MIKKTLSLTGIVTTCLLSINAFATPVSDAVEHALGQSKSRGFKNANVGIVVTSLKTGKVLYQRNMNHLYTPASVQKLFTASAALTYLKPSFRFQTGFYTNGKIRHHELDGNLYIKFSGDPSLKSQQLKQMVAELHNMNVYRIRGNVYIDNTDYGHVPYAPGFIWDDLSYSYAAPMNAIIIDRNKFGVRFKPANKVGEMAQIVSTLPSGVVHFDNHLYTRKNYAEHCPIAIYSNNHNEYKITGCLVQRWGAQSRSLAVRDVVKYAEVEMATLLHQANIHYTGQIRLGTKPKAATPLVLHDSKPLSQLLRHMLKKSDNVYTNAIFKKLGEAYYNGYGSWQNSLLALKHVLSASAGINFHHNLLADGAGLSRYNLISPHQLVQLLYYVYHNPSIRPALYEALPIAGRDGTLESRMLREGKSERVHAKTGSMTGVSTLAGFIESRHHGMLGFAIMANGFVGGRSPYIHMEDRVCEALAKS